MDLYINWVSTYPLSSAAIQFAILGTLGEFISFWIRTRSMRMPCKPWQILCKMAAWALLGIIIKYGFTGMKGFVLALLDHHLLPEMLRNGLGWALTVSVMTNIFFGPQMMFFHRIEDNLITWRWDVSGMTKAWWTLIWFWIPAHTVTFALPKDFQIGLAAVWSLALGVIMGLTAPKK